MDKELEPKLLECLANPPCKDCDDWDRQGHFCYHDVTRQYDKECKFKEMIDTIYAGYVRLDPDTVAIRLHTHDRALLRVIDEVSPCNCTWEALPDHLKEGYLREAKEFVRGN